MDMWEGVQTSSEAWSYVGTQRKHKGTLGQLAGVLKTGNAAPPGFCLGGHLHLFKWLQDLEKFKKEYGCHLGFSRNDKDGLN